MEHHILLIFQNNLGYSLYLRQWVEGKREELAIIEDIFGRLNVFKTLLQVLTVHIQLIFLLLIFSQFNIQFGVIVDAPKDIGLPLQLEANEAEVVNAR